MNWQHAWERALPYATFLEVHGDAGHRERWQRIQEASPAVLVRFMDRDSHPDVQDALVLDTGRRVPLVEVALSLCPEGRRGWVRTGLGSG